jgi:8-oxo-dGTP pyrophosphatase MutT (NUDIX family)
MELNHHEITSPVRDAASVLMLRDGAQGLEIFMLQRHNNSAVLGGAYVFPGGKLDAADAELDPVQHLDQPRDVLHRQLAEPELDPARACGLYVAALREAFEESGILFAHGPHGQAPDAVRAIEQLRAGLSFPDLLRQMSLQLTTRFLVPWSRWITPRLASVSSQRFDTRFFVAAVPKGQDAVHDNVETTHSVWLRPRQALEDYWARRIDLAPPQIMSLVQLLQHDTVQAVLDESRQQPPATIEPEPFDDNGVRTICYPGDPRHSQTHRAMRGPTRLRFVDRRFEPVEGFEAFFS